MTYSNAKLKALFSRIANGKAENTDEQDIKDFIGKVFNGGQNPDPSLLWQFNNLVVQTANEIAKPMVTDVLSLFANTQNQTPGNIIELKIPQKNKAKVIWSASGSGVDLTRVAGRKTKLAVPAHLSTGFYYEPLDLVRESIDYFNFLVNDVANAKVRLYLDKVYEMIAAAVSSGDIPAANVVAGDNLTIAQYNKLASTISRVAGGKTIFVADSLMIDYFLNQIAAATPSLLSDALKDEILTQLNPAQIGRTTAVNLVNPFIDDDNTKAELPVNKGYMFSGGTNVKPFQIVEYGGLKQLTEQDIEDERIKMKITQDASIDLIYGNAVGYVTENTAVTL